MRSKQRFNTILNRLLLLVTVATGGWLIAQCPWPVKSAPPQASAACRFTVTPTKQSFDAQGGSGTLTITASDTQCGWLVRSNAPWLTLSSAPRGVGNATLTYLVAPALTGRAGTLTVAGHTINIWQAANACGAPAFTTLATYPAGESGPMAAADFDLDGALDLVICGDSQGALLLNDGHGGFTPPRQVRNAGAEFSYALLSTADLNRDGYPDLTIADSPPGNNLQVLLNDKRGNFLPGQLYALDSRAGGLVTGDFNNDGKLDLVLGDYENHGLVWFFPGAGDGSFGQFRRINFDIATYLRTQNATDFDGDGKLDLIVSNNNGVLFSKGDGNGGFNTSPVVLYPGNASLLAISDFNGDGQRDILLNTGIGQQSSLTLLPGLGNATFGAPVQTMLTYSLATGGVQIGDLNQDGRPDLVGKNFNGTLALFANDGMGRFMPPLNYFDGGTPDMRFSALGDFTGDGKLDVASVGYNKRVSVVPGLGNGQLDAPRHYPLYDPLHSLSVPLKHALDFNGDANPDLLTVGVAAGGNGRILLQLGDGQSGFGALQQFEAGPRPSALAVGDLNNDGKLDLALASESTNTISVLFNNGATLFAAPLTISLPGSPQGIAIGEFAADGAPDIAVSFKPEYNNGQYQIRLLVLPGNGGGQFGTPLSSAFSLLASDYPHELTVADLNQDMRDDVLLAPRYAYDFGISVLLNDGAGVFRETTKLRLQSQADGPKGGSAPLVSDLNGDGNLDVVFAPVSGGGGAVVAWGDGIGNFSPPQFLQFQVGSGRLPYASAFHDFNGDGRPDLLATSVEGIRVLLGNGAGQFSLPFVFATGNTEQFAVGDFNNDGRLDLAAQNGTIFLNRCAVSNQAVSVSAASFEGTELAPDSLVALFGDALANATQIAGSQPWPTELAGTTVSVRDQSGTAHAALLSLVSPTQINLLLPGELAEGPAIVTVTNAAGTQAQSPLQVRKAAPALFTANGSGHGLAAGLALRVKANGAQSYEPIGFFDPQSNRFVARPLDLGPPSDQVFLLLFGTGIRHHEPFEIPSVYLASGIFVEQLEPSFAAAQGTLAGVDQINVRLPRNWAGRGEVNVTFALTPQFQPYQTRFSNTVKINLR